MILPLGGQRQRRLFSSSKCRPKNQYELSITKYIYFELYERFIHSYIQSISMTSSTLSSSISSGFSAPFPAVESCTFLAYDRLEVVVKRAVTVMGRTTVVDILIPVAPGPP
mmetsp:Transcript_20076/g.43690  ORF Transcript_20076/g.43690 Transcript_20076/m.43690 type:complete len:111 (-) Transcript_20076:1235-1567(-)